MIRKELLEVLFKMKPGLSSKDRIDQASSFVFTGGSIVTFNEAVMVMCDHALDFEGAVRAEELLGVLGKLSAEKVDLSFDSGQLIVKAGRSRSGIKFEEEVRLPIDGVTHALKGAAFVKMPDGLLDACQRARFCASQSMSNLKLTGLHVYDGRVTSTDNYRIFQTTVKGIKKLPEFILPASCVDFLTQYELTKMAITDTWAFFVNDNGLTLCVRLIDCASDPYPVMDQHFVVDGPELILPQGVADAIDKTAIFTKSTAHEHEKVVSVTLKPGRVIVRGEGAYGWYEENVIAKEYEGEELSFSTHPTFLREILPLVQRATLGTSVILFEGDNFRHVFTLTAV